MNNAVGFLLLCFTVLGDTSGDDPLKRVHAFVGLSVVLPCQQYLPENTEVPTIEWSKLGLKPAPFVFVYRSYEVYGDKHKDFEFRTHLFMTDLHRGNFSMKLSDVRETDAGIYLCKTIWNKDKTDTKKVEVVVDTVPTPALSVVSIGNGVVNLSCEVRACFLTTARLTFWDGRGNLLNEDKAKRVNEDGSECSSLELQVTAPASAKSVVCRAEFEEIGQSRDTHMLIPEDSKESCTFPMVLTGIVAVVAILILVGAGFGIDKCCCKTSRGEKKKISRGSSGETTTSNESETNPLFKQEESCTIEIEQTQVTNLTQEPPGPISSTPDSTVSKADSRNGSVLELFSVATDNDVFGANPATCEINGATKSVKFTNNEEEHRAKLTRQDACTNEISCSKSLSKSASSLTTKSPTKNVQVKRSRSASDSYYVAVEDLKSRRHSLSGLKADGEKTRLLKLEEESEQDGLPSKIGRQE